MDRDLDLSDGKDLVQCSRGYLNKESPFASVYENPRQIEDRSFHIDGQARACAKWAGAAEEVSGDPGGCPLIAGRHGFHAHEARELPGGNLAIPMHQHEQRLVPIRLHDQRLDQNMLRQVELGGSHLGASMLLILVEVRHEIDPPFPQKPHPWRYRTLRLGHSSLLGRDSTKYLQDILWNLRQSYLATIVRRPDETKSVLYGPDTQGRRFAGSVRTSGYRLLRACFFFLGRVFPKVPR